MLGLSFGDWLLFGKTSICKMLNKMSWHVASIFSITQLPLVVRFSIFNCASYRFYEYLVIIIYCMFPCDWRRSYIDLYTKEQCQDILGNIWFNDNHIFKRLRRDLGSASYQRPNPMCITAIYRGVLNLGMCQSSVELCYH